MVRATIYCFVAAVGGCFLAFTTRFLIEEGEPMKQSRMFHSPGDLAASAAGGGFVVAAIAAPVLFFRVILCGVTVILSVIGSAAILLVV